MSGEDKRSAEIPAAVAPVPVAEVPAQSESVEKVGEDEPMVNLGSDHDDYPEMYQSSDEKVESEEAKVDLKNKIKVGEQDQVSAEVQELRSKVFLLEELWKTERALREMIEERNELKAQVDRMKAEGGGSSEGTSKKDKKKKKRDNDIDNYENSNPKKKQVYSKILCVSYTMKTHKRVMDYEYGLNEIRMENGVSVKWGFQLRTHISS